MRGGPLRQYPKNSILGRGGEGEALNREPLVDILRPGLVVSAIVAVGQSFETFLLAGIYKDFFGAEFIREAFAFGVEGIAANNVCM